MAPPVSLLIVGAGERGSVYAQYAHENPSLCRVVAVAEPRKVWRERLQQRYAVPADAVFDCWEAAAARARLADAVVIAVPDRLHRAAAVAFAERGYAMLLEKPMATELADCQDVVAAVKRAGIIFGVAHVLRYTPYSQAFYRLARQVGAITAVHHTEPVGYWHFAHSYVRGNWRRSRDSSCSLLAKCCHDVDWIMWVLQHRRCLRVSSFGSLQYFTKANKPLEAGDATRCLDCAIVEQCPYSAKKIYLDSGTTEWPVSVVCAEPTPDAITRALQSGPYGVCVYEADNDVVDHQVVIFEFEGGPVVTLSMVACSKELCVRQTRLYGSHGELTGDGATIRHADFTRPNAPVVAVTPEDSAPTGTRMRGHGGADYHFMRAFVAAVASGDQAVLACTPDEVLQSHKLVFCAERARVSRSVVELGAREDDNKQR